MNNNVMNNNNINNNKIVNSKEDINNLIYNSDLDKEYNILIDNFNIIMKKITIKQQELEVLENEKDEKIIIIKELLDKK